MAAYMVVYGVSDEDGSSTLVTDHWEVFTTEDRLDAKAMAVLRYEELLKRPDTYSASVAQVLMSTDYMV